MIFQWYNLLAADDNGTGNIIFLVVMIALAFIGHIAKKIQEKRQADQADQAERGASAVKERRAVAPKPPGARKAAPPARRAPTPAEQAAAALRSAFGELTGTEQPPPQPPPQAPPPTRAKAGEGVRREVRRARQHLADEEAQQRRRLGTIEPLHPGIADAPDRAGTPPAEHARRIRLDLAGRKAARTAIICSEIIGPPKALKTGPEPWDM